MRWDAWVRGGRFVTVEGQPIFYRVDGAGPTVVFLHGFPTSSHDWDGVIAALAPRFRCVSFDLLGFGASAKPAQRYTYAQQLRVLSAVLAVTETRVATVVAHDYSVTLAQLLLARGSELALTGVALCNGGVHPDLHRPRPVQRILASPLGRALGPLVSSRRTLERTLRSVLARPERMDLDDVWAAVSAGDGVRRLPALLHYIAERKALGAALPAALVTAPVPLAFAWGEADPISGAHVSAWIRGHVPRAELLTLDGVGHYPQNEALPEVAAFLGAFCARVAAT